MKHLKLYEDFDWEFDEDETPDFNIVVNDRVKTKYNYYYRSMEDNDNTRENLTFVKADQITTNSYIVREIINYNDKKIMIIGTDKNNRNWPWYDCEYWEVVY